MEEKFISPFIFTQNRINDPELIKKSAKQKLNDPGILHAIEQKLDSDTWDILPGHKAVRGNFLSISGGALVNGIPGLFLSFCGRSAAGTWSDRDRATSQLIYHLSL